jgi:hypothetical protein
MSNISTTRQRQLARLGRSALAAALVAVLLLVEAMAASPELHQRIHHDADAPDHECAVTMFAHGQTDAAPVDVPIVASLILIETVFPVEISAFCPSVLNLPADRGPPVLPVVS